MVSIDFVNNANMLGTLVCLRKTPIGTCTVRQLEDVRWLLIDNTLQSVSDLTQPQQFLLPHLQQLASLWQTLPEPNNILEVGLGGGAIRNYLNASYPHCNITTIEKSQDIIELYTQYFASLPQSNLIAGDITTYHFSNSYNWIVLDLFSKQDCPIFLFQREFYQRVKSLFVDDANRHLFINFICESAQQLNSLRTVLTSVFKADVTIYAIKDYNNKIVHLHF
ncbi:spermidine synthase [Pseudoalteromonas sp. T1lg24]|uniref:spermidine synthase n=1 Tax=Pseudoalteromonas sp. T1lg24 TaxID=2077099 RepID=UPI000CF73294|nr:SAM-dependent methyltransferase [Pseudoalteromonas sp. T1lg24]